jgi:prepilin-type N-terminal cleavage/methylation domain-containing protein
VNSCRDGLTFVEVLIAVLILGILAIAGGALIQRGQIETVRQKFKRAAIEAANSQMEKVVRNESFNVVSNWIGSPRGTNITLNGVNGFGMTTIVANATSGDNCIKITVRVEYLKGTGSVELVTYRSPGGI